MEKQEERLSRLPRVILAWRLPSMPHDDAVVLELGAQLLTLLTDGAWGMRIGADLTEYAGESLFTMELTTPYDETTASVKGDAEGFLRMLTHRELPIDFLVAANLALDRHALFGLDSLEGRARALTELELRAGGRMTLSEYLGWHWLLDGSVLRDTARQHLKGPRLVLHARPDRPKKARAERE